MATEVNLRNCQLAFRCKQKWEEMTPTRPDGTVRFCLDCMTEVFFCRTDQDLINHIRWNHCVAFERIVKERRHVLLGDPVVRKNPS